MEHQIEEVSSWEHNSDPPDERNGDTMAIEYGKRKADPLNNEGHQPHKLTRKENGTDKINNDQNMNEKENGQNTTIENTAGATSYFGGVTARKDSPTVTSENETTTENTIIIEPDSEHAKKFFSNSIAVYRLILASLIGQAKILESSRNLKRQIQIIKIQNINLIPDILKITNIGEYKVKCQIPYAQASLIYRDGVIGPFGVDTEPELVQELLMEGGFTGLRVTRIMKGKVPTTQLKVRFPSATLPERVVIMHERFKVRQFMDRPWQCYQCQGFGHSAKYCRGTERCLICAGPHNMKECTEKETGKKQCVNCGGAHIANYGGCQSIRKEKEVQKVRCEEHITYSEAIKRIQKKKQQPSTSEGTELIPRAAALEKTKGKEINSNQKKMCTVATQTTTVEVSTNTGSDVIEIPESKEKIDEKYAAFILEVICTVAHVDTLQKKCSAVSTAYTNHYSSYLNTNEIVKCLTGKLNKKGTPTKQMNPTAVSQSGTVTGLPPSQGKQGKSNSQIQGKSNLLNV